MRGFRTAEEEGRCLWGFSTDPARGDNAVFEAKDFLPADHHGLVLVADLTPCKFSHCIVILGRIGLQRKACEARQSYSRITCSRRSPMCNTKPESSLESLVRSSSGTLQTLNAVLNADNQDSKTVGERSC